jgi:hypothetical protein
MRFRAVTGPVARVATRAIDRFPYTAVVVRALRMAGGQFLLLVGILGTCAAIKGLPASMAWFLALAIVCRVVYVRLAVHASVRQMARIVGDAATFQPDWSYREGPRVHGLDCLQPCSRCGRRLRPGERTVGGVAAVPEPPRGLQRSMSHIAYLYCERCGAELRRGPPRPEATTKTSKRRDVPRTPTRPPVNKPLRTASIVAVLASGGVFVFAPPLGLGAFVLIMVVSLAGILGFWVAHLGWSWYSENPALLAVVLIALIGAGLKGGGELWEQQHPPPVTIPGAASLAAIFIPAGSADGRRVAELLRLEDAASLGSGLFTPGGSTGVSRAEYAQARRLRDPAVRRYCLRIAAARRRWGSALVDAAAAKARSDSAAASYAQFIATQADQEARLLRSRLVVSG